MNNIKPEDRAKILQTKEEIEITQKELFNKLINQYLSIIKKEYQSLNPEDKKILVGELDKLVEKLDRGTLSQIDVFDPDIAREIRKDEGLTITELVKILGLNNLASARSQINRYETGKVVPLNFSTAEVSSKYIPWLKERGYNPFKL